MTIENNKEEASTAELGDQYNGKPMFTINKASRYPFTFGLPKARLILQHIDKLKKFVASEGKET